MSALLVLPAVLAFALALADAPHSAESAPQAPSDAALAASPQRQPTVLDTDPGRVWMGGVLGATAGIVVGFEAGPKGLVGARVVEPLLAFRF